MYLQLGLEPPPKQPRKISTGVTHYQVRPDNFGLIESGTVVEALELAMRFVSKRGKTPWQETDDQWWRSVMDDPRLGRK